MRVPRLCFAVVFANFFSCHVLAITHLTDGSQDDINLRPSGKRHMRREMSSFSLGRVGEQPRSRSQALNVLAGPNKPTTESLLQREHITIQGTLELKVQNATTFVNNDTRQAVIDGMADACAVEPDQVVLDYYHADSEGGTATEHGPDRLILVFNITMLSTQEQEVKDSVHDAATELNQIDDRMRSALNIPITDDSFSVEKLWLNADTTTTTTTTTITTTATTTTPLQVLVDTGILAGHIDLRVQDVDEFVKMPQAVEAIKAALANVADIDESKVVTSDETVDALSTVDVRFNFNLTVPEAELQIISDSIKNANLTMVEEQIEYMLANDNIIEECTVRHLATKDSAVISPAVTRIKVVGSILIEADDVEQAKANRAVEQQLKSDLEMLSGVGLQGNFVLNLELAPSLLHLVDDDMDDENSDGPSLVMEASTFNQKASVMNVSYECSVPSTFPGGAMAVVRNLHKVDQDGLESRVQEVFTNEGLGTVKIIQITAELWFPPTSVWHNHDTLWSVNHHHEDHSSGHVAKHIHHDVHHADGALNMSDMTMIVGNMTFETDHEKLWTTNPHTTLALSMAIGYVCKIPVEEIVGMIHEDEDVELLQTHHNSDSITSPTGIHAQPLSSEENGGARTRTYYIYKFKIDTPKMWADEAIELLEQVNDTNLRPMFEECLSYAGITTIHFALKDIMVGEESLPLAPDHSMADLVDPEWLHKG